MFVMVTFTLRLNSVYRPCLPSVILNSIALCMSYSPYSQRVNASSMCLCLGRARTASASMPPPCASVSGVPVQPARQCLLPVPLSQACPYSQRVNASSLCLCLRRARTASASMPPPCASVSGVPVQPARQCLLPVPLSQACPYSQRVNASSLCLCLRRARTASVSMPPPCASVSGVPVQPAHQCLLPVPLSQAACQCLLPVPLSQACPYSQRVNASSLCLCLRRARTASVSMPPPCASVSGVPVQPAHQCLLPVPLSPACPYSQRVNASSLCLCLRHARTASVSMPPPCASVSGMPVQPARQCLLPVPLSQAACQCLLPVPLSQACPYSQRVNASSMCHPCSETPTFYDWLYLGFMALLSPALHCFFIDFTNKNKRYGTDSRTIYFHCEFHCVCRIFVPFTYII